MRVIHRLALILCAGRSFVHVSAAEQKRVLLLMDLAYTCAHEAIPFIKFGPLAESQKRAGVQLGETYLNDRGAKEFTMTVGDQLDDQLKQQLMKTDFITVLVDGSTDCCVREGVSLCQIC